MKTKLIATLLLAGSSLFAGPRVFFGFGVPVPAPAAVVTYAAPGPGYVWVNGGFFFVGGRRIWREGYWRAPVGHFYGRFHR